MRTRLDRLLAVSAAMLMAGAAVAASQSYAPPEFPEWPALGVPLLWASGYGPGPTRSSVRPVAAAVCGANKPEQAPSSYG